MTLSVSQNLSHTHWPVRLAAMWLLANQQKDTFQSVLDWNAHPGPLVKQAVGDRLGPKCPNPYPTKQSDKADPMTPKKGGKILLKYF
jgi:hypothetical protein